MLPPSRMVATKNRAGRSSEAGSTERGAATPLALPLLRVPCSVLPASLLLVALAVLIAGCTPPGPRALLDGKRLLDEGQYPQAVEKLKVATSLLSTNAHAWNYLGLACHRAGEPTSAAVAYQRALTLNRDLLEARYNLGCLWLDQNKLDEARAEFTAYTLRRGNEVEGWLKLGAVQLRSRDPNGAEKSFREALRVSPQKVEAYNGLGLAQLQRNRPREAAKYFGVALKQQPNYRPALLNLATVLHQHLNDRAGALQKYREYLALRPKPADWESVNALVQSLEQPVAVEQRPPVTNLIAHVAPTTNVNKTTTAAVTRVAAPPKTNSTPALTKTALPPPVQTAPVEVVTLPPEPVIKLSPDTPSASETPTTQPPAVETASRASPIAAPSVSSKPDKPGFISRLFRRDARSAPRPKPLPPATEIAAANSTPAVSTNAKTSPDDGASVPAVSKTAPAQGSVAKPSSISRYRYLSPSKPASGNRREAERAFAQGQQSQRANRLAEAAQAYRQATVLDPSYFEACYNLGLTAYETRSYRQALTAWENALAIQPESVDARYNFALALKAANYPMDAAKELEKILAASPNETRAHLLLGNLYAEQLDDVSQARTQYLKVLELDPRHPQATAIRYWLVAHPQ